MVFIVFLILKLAEIGVVATWSWWWVTAPLWIPSCIVIAILLAIGSVAAAVLCGKMYAEHRAEKKSAARAKKRREDIKARKSEQG
jgi:uncharacterized membrane protein YciS (DUF1049 family)